MVKFLRRIGQYLGLIYRDDGRLRIGPFVYRSVPDPHDESARNDAD
jgi:hypothetical protein